MKFLVFKTGLILLLATILPGCKDHYLSQEGKRILFQYEYIRGSGDDEHHGFIIDSEGNLFTYNNPEDWNFPDKDLIISHDKVSENLEKCTLTGTKIPVEELTKYSKFIENISSSKVTALKNVKRGEGTTEFICFQYSGSLNSYQGHLIKMEGERTRENLNFYARKVTAWMREISDTLEIK